MNERTVRLRLFFIPYLTISLSFIIAYTLLHWCLIVKLNLFSLKDSIVGFFLPALLPWIPVLVWMWPRIKLFSFKDPDRLVFFYAFIAAAFISAPAVIMQQYMTSATGKLTHLVNIEEIYSQPATKFYTVDRYYPKKQHARFHFTSNTSGKYNHRLNYHCYIVVPVYNADPETVKQNVDTPEIQIRPIDYIELSPDELVIQSSPKAWLGFKFSMDMPNKANREEKEMKWQEFRMSCIQRFNILSFPKFQYLERIEQGDEKRNYIKAIWRIRDFPKLPHPYNIFIPRENAFADRDNQKVIWLAITFCGGMLTWLLMIMLPKISPLLLYYTSTFSCLY